MRLRVEDATGALEPLLFGAQLALRSGRGESAKRKREKPRAGLSTACVGDCLKRTYDIPIAINDCAACVSIYDPTRPADEDADRFLGVRAVNLTDMPSTRQLIQDKARAGGGRGPPFAFGLRLPALVLGSVTVVGHVGLFCD